MRRTKAEAEQTRHDILKAALILFDEQGYVQTSLSDIARKAEVTRGAIYWHFDNKEQIVAALVQAQFDDLMRQNAAAISAPDIWQTLGDNFIAYFHELIRSPDRLRFYRAFHQHGKAAPPGIPRAMAGTMPRCRKTRQRKRRTARRRRPRIPLLLPLDDVLRPD